MINLDNIEKSGPGKEIWEQKKKRLSEEILWREMSGNATEVAKDTDLEKRNGSEYYRNESGSFNS